MTDELTLFPGTSILVNTVTPKPRPRPSPPKSSAVIATGAFDFADQFWVFEQKVDSSKRTSLVIVTGVELKSFERKKAKWKKAHPDPFATRAEAISFIDGLGSLYTLEDPNRAPRRPGGPEEVKRIETLRSLQMSVALDALTSRKEYDLLYSMLYQYDHQASYKTLTPKQWGFVWDLFDRIALRQRVRKEGRR